LGGKIAVHQEKYYILVHVDPFNFTGMRIVPFIVSAVISISVILVLSVQWGSLPPIGKFLSPQHGFWQNAEAVDKDLSGLIELPELMGKAQVYLDDRLVPHVFAENEEDAYFIQGYLHAKFRLWQMEFQVYAASGRLSELVGAKALPFDRDKRRLGMVYAAEKAMKETEKTQASKSECDSYTSGVNAYIESLKESELPVEYKLLDYRPEKWTNLKTALFLKYMSLELAGSENDFEYSNAKNVFGLSDFEKMYPVTQDSLDPIVPRDSLDLKSSVSVKIPVSADSLYFRRQDSVTQISYKPSSDNGSNNWAVSGKKTKSGAPILCNDPHLGLNLPSLWFEMQLSTPHMNVYGASFPGSPGIIIGFNDSCAFGFTNAGRDVRDYYEIRFRDETMKDYWFNGRWKASDFRFEHILVKGQPEYIDTIAYTIFGPVMFDKKFSGTRTASGKYYAVRWSAHDPSNELMMFNRLDHARNYDDYYQAIQWLHTPGQNCVFACKNGDIAIWDQGEFPAKWWRQGDFIMPGEDSSYMWQASIPQSENPHSKNPDRGFVSSANQLPVDPATYPFYLGGRYPPYRGLIINRLLGQMTDITPKSMMGLQTENYDVFAEMAQPVLLRNLDPAGFDEDQKHAYDLLQSWDLRDDPAEKGATLFALTWDSLQSVVWDDELKSTHLAMVYPTQSTLLEGILKDSAFKFLDNINTPQKETLQDDIGLAFRKALGEFDKLDLEGRAEWSRYKDTRVSHLLPPLKPFSREHLLIGGGANCINAAKSDHGPSWRMIVQLTANTEAYGIYPGGQSGNPGSPFYDGFIDDWVAGKYYQLWMMGSTEGNDSRVRAKMTFAKKLIP
jgi:penicillin amidase